MISKSIREQRCEDVLNAFMKGSNRPVFFTLTTADVVDLVEIRSRWRAFRHWLVRQLPKGVKYVMNYEIHPGGHGWHIHSVFNCYIPLKSYLPTIRFFGFGRVDVRRVDSSGVADYLTKHALKAYRGLSRREMERNHCLRRMRLVNTSRGLPTLDSYSWVSDHKERTRHLLALSGMEGLFSALDFHTRFKVAGLAASFGVRHSFELSVFFNAYMHGPDVLLDTLNSFTPAKRPVRQMRLKLPSSRTGKGISCGEGHLPIEDDLLRRRSDKS